MGKWISECSSLLRSYHIFEGSLALGGEGMKGRMNEGTNEVVSVGNDTQ